MQSLTPARRRTSRVPNCGGSQDTGLDGTARHGATRDRTGYNHRTEDTTELDRTGQNGTERNGTGLHGTERHGPAPGTTRVGMGQDRPGRVVLTLTGTHSALDTVRPQHLAEVFAIGGCRAVLLRTRRSVHVAGWLLGGVGSSGLQPLSPERLAALLHDVVEDGAGESQLRHNPVVHLAPLEKPPPPRLVAAERVFYRHPGVTEAGVEMLLLGRQGTSAGIAPHQPGRKWVGGIAGDAQRHLLAVERHGTL